MLRRTLRHSFFLGAFLFALCPPGYAQSIESRAADSLRAESAPVPENRVDREQSANLIVEKTNEFRRSHGLSSLEADAELADTARYFADYMARTDRYGHHADGNRPPGRAENQGYDYCLIAENIAHLYKSTGFSTTELAQRFIQGWKESPGHRENMLGPAYQQIGAAVARSDETGHWYAVQMFGRPQSASIEFNLENRTGETIRYAVGERSFELPPRYTRTHIRCRTLAVDVEAASLPTLSPTGGERYTITNEQGELALDRRQRLRTDSSRTAP